LTPIDTSHSKTSSTHHFITIEIASDAGTFGGDWVGDDGEEGEEEEEE
tara:strand:- start:269 stop:412 length:144 start_codon:yes stop_codon:yes gene_type:complete